MLIERITVIFYAASLREYGNTHEVMNVNELNISSIHASEHLALNPLMFDLPTLALDRAFSSSDMRNIYINSLLNC